MTRMAALNLLFAWCFPAQRAQYAAYEPAGHISTEKFHGNSKIKQKLYHDWTILNDPPWFVHWRRQRSQTTEASLTHAAQIVLWCSMQYRVEMCRVYRCDRVYQWRQVLGVITVITQWYPMISNTSSASPWIPWPNVRRSLQIAMIPPTWSGCGTQRRRMYTAWPGRLCQAVSGCVRLFRLVFLPLCSSQLADGCDLGSVMGKNM